jgi:hypothetical protein
MARLCAFLAVLLLLLTFNAYACVLPLSTPAEMNCASTTEEPTRQTCDAFLEIGPHSEGSSNHSVTTLHLDVELPVPFPGPIFSVSQPARPSGSIDTHLHLSIHTTVLRT